MQDKKDKPEYDGPSKSQKKRDMHTLQSLGEELVRLSSDRLAKLDIDESLRDAIIEAHRIQTKTEAFRRQMQYVGKLMRHADTGPIRAALEAASGKSRTETARMHRLESLRDRFIEDEHLANEIVTLYPEADIQHLRQLRRNAIREKEQNRPPRSYRELYRELRALDTSGQEAASSDDTDNAQTDDE